MYFTSNFAVPKLIQESIQNDTHYITLIYASEATLN